ncbi:MAG: hypothetical protein U9N52_05410 [Campylobacterota bacterium]|nr:hypothetical protein [Campylobacterota bacterium]
MRKFWFLLWFDWALWVSVSSLIFAAVIDFFVTGTLYVLKGMAELNSETLSALADIWLFWFGIIWSVTLLLSIFLSMKRFFNVCHDGWKLQLFTCAVKNAEVIDIVLLGDIVKVWRKWLMALIWAVATEILMVSVVRYILGFGIGFWEWFTMGWLYLFILLAAWVSLPLMAARCQRVTITSC